MEAYWVYIVECRDASYYIGITNDAERRVAEHNQGIDPHCYTFSRRPVKLVYTSEFRDPNEAIRFEKQIKGWSRKKKAALIRGDWEAVVRSAREIRRP
ncbi:MAG TPA: GIY-YIG nuclease family protein [Candidatus Baltobacteraceae bacterium]|jgi:putative endonuclease|nr:GIY-YIG nuclease family protein [Candidatus Baltobacteraceae bacterium]